MPARREPPAELLPLCEYWHMCGSSSAHSGQVFTSRGGSGLSGRGGGIGNCGGYLTAACDWSPKFCKTVNII